MSELRLDELTVSYGRREVTALQPFSDTVRSGEWVGIIGPNGAGKSSLLRAVAGLVDFAGSADVDGVRLDSMTDRQRAAVVAYVPQMPIIPDDMSADDYVALGRTPHIEYFGSMSRNDRSVVDQVIEQLQLGEFVGRPMGTLSGGERQRVVLARAFAQQAPILLLDEPTSALDIGRQQQALELVAELRELEHLTVVSALHDLTLAGSYADRLVMLDHGSVVARGSAVEVLTEQRIAEVYDVAVSVSVSVEVEVEVDVDHDAATGKPDAATGKPDGATGKPEVVVVPRRIARRQRTGEAPDSSPTT